MTNPQGHYDWSAYFDAVKENPPRETLVRALELFEADAGHHAVHPQVGRHADPPAKPVMPPLRTSTRAAPRGWR